MGWTIPHAQSVASSTFHPLGECVVVVEALNRKADAGTPIVHAIGVDGAVRLVPGGGTRYRLPWAFSRPPDRAGTPRTPRCVAD